MNNSTPTLSGYNLTRMYYSTLYDNREMQQAATPSHAAIFMAIVEYQNRLGWQLEIVGLPKEDIMLMSHIASTKTYYKVLKDLEKWGFLRIISASKNIYTATKISLYTDKLAAISQESTEENNAFTKKCRGKFFRCDDSAVDFTEVNFSEAGDYNKTNTETLNTNKYINKGESEKVKEEIQKVNERLVPDIVMVSDAPTEIPIQKNNQMKKDSKVFDTLSQKAIIILAYFNEKMNKRFKSLKFAKNLQVWLEVYSMEEIFLAIDKWSIGTFWASVSDANLDFLFRLRNQKGENVDYIGQLLNHRPDPKKLAQIKQPIQYTDGSLL